MLSGGWRPLPGLPTAIWQRADPGASPPGAGLPRRGPPRPSQGGRIVTTLPKPYLTVALTAGCPIRRRPRPCRSDTVSRYRCLLLAGLLAGPVTLAAGPALAQDRPQEAPPPPASTAPPPAVTNPLPTTTTPDTGKPDPNRTTAPQPEKALTPPVGSPAPAAAPAARKTLVETPGDANDVDEVSLPPKPAAILTGKAKWEEAVPSLKAAFARIEADLAKLGVAPTGRPIAVFAKTDDDGFQYEAMVPVAEMPASKPPEGDGIRFGTTPSGKALRFPHKGSYDEIDGTYETLTAYLDAKDIVVQDRFIEEYVTDLNDRADEKLDVNIYALVK